MTVLDLLQKEDFTALNAADKNRAVTGCYIGDLLSFVMGRAKENDLWITIMSNINVAAVASLADVSAVILAEGVTPDDDLLTAAKQKQINLILTNLTAYEAAIKISRLLK